MIYKVLTTELQRRNCVYYIDANSPNEIYKDPYNLLVDPDYEEFDNLEDLEITKIEEIGE